MGAGDGRPREGSLEPSMAIEGAPRFVPVKVGAHPAVRLVDGRSRTAPGRLGAGAWSTSWSGRRCGRWTGRTPAAPPSGVEGTLAHRSLDASTRRPRPSTRHLRSGEGSPHGSATGRWLPPKTPARRGVVFVANPPSDLGRDDLRSVVQRHGPGSADAARPARRGASPACAPTSASRAPWSGRRTPPSTDAPDRTARRASRSTTGDTRHQRHSRGPDDHEAVPLEVVVARNRGGAPAELDPIEAMRARRLDFASGPDDVPNDPLLRRVAAWIASPP